MSDFGNSQHVQDRAAAAPPDTAARANDTTRMAGRARISGAGNGAEWRTRIWNLWIAIVDAAVHFGRHERLKSSMRDLPDHILSDIGLTRAEMMHQAASSFARRPRYSGARHSGRAALQ